MYFIGPQKRFKEDHDGAFCLKGLMGCEHGGLCWFCMTDV